MYPMNCFAAYAACVITLGILTKLFMLALKNAVRATQPRQDYSRSQVAFPLGRSLHPNFSSAKRHLHAGLIRSGAAVCLVYAFMKGAVGFWSSKPKPKPLQPREKLLAFHDLAKVSACDGADMWTDLCQGPWPQHVRIRQRCIWGLRRIEGCLSTWCCAYELLQGKSSTLSLLAMQEAFDRAHEAEVERKPEAAIRLYRTGIEAAAEGLGQQVRMTEFAYMRQDMAASFATGVIMRSMLGQLHR